MSPDPRTSGEKDALLAFLAQQRRILLWKLEGLDDEELRRPVVPSGTNLLGLVKHVAAVQYGWFCATFGRETEPLPFDEDDEDADLRVEPWESTDEVLAFYARSAVAADAVIEELDLDDRGTAWTGATVSLRWVVLHMLEEIARHLGHADLARELIDGTTGYLPGGASSSE
jgi:uncharacterized damage-inducible protein DinB